MRTFNLYIAIGHDTVVVKGATEFEQLATKEPARIPCKAPAGGKTIFSASLVPVAAVEVVVHEIPEDEEPKTEEKQ